MRPCIGIPLCLDERGRWREGREYSYIDCAYARAVEAAGGTPVLLPMQRDVAPLLERIDGLLLPGGDDFPPPAAHPVVYPTAVRFDAVPETQLAFDTQLLLAARSRDLPVFGICYGMQLMGLAAGATLHYHLPSDLPEAGEHRLPESREARHAVEVAAGTRLAEALGSGRRTVNSLHHQALASAGRGMRVCARSDDGVIEAVESEAKSWWLGVQWHPEKLPAEESAGLFRAFVEAARSG